MVDLYGAWDMAHNPTHLSLTVLELRNISRIFVGVWHIWIGSEVTMAWMAYRACCIKSTAL